MDITKLIDLVAEVVVQKTLARKKEDPDETDTQAISSCFVAKSRLAFQVFLRDHLSISSLLL
jgi:hypothetical protein